MTAIEESFKKRGFKPQDILKVAEKHVRLYERRIARGGSWVRIDECQALLQLWQGVVRGQGEVLTPNQMYEILDADDAGEFEEFTIVIKE